MTITDTIGYISVTDANDYISSHFLSDNAQRTKWEALADEDKIVLVTRAYEDIDNLKFAGNKSTYEQTTQFPRSGSKIIPTEVKHAQVLQAISYLADNSGFDAIRNGIAAESVGSLSTTYNTKLVGQMKIQSSDAYKLIYKFIKKSWDII